MGLTHFISMKWRGISILLKHDPSGTFDKPKNEKNRILFSSIDEIPHLATMRKMKKIIVISHLSTCVIFVTFFILPWKSAFDLPSSSDGVHWAQWKSSYCTWNGVALSNLDTMKWRGMGLYYGVWWGWFYSFFKPVNWCGMATKGFPKWRSSHAISTREMAWNIWIGVKSQATPI